MLYEVITGFGKQESDQQAADSDGAVEQGVPPLLPPAKLGEQGAGRGKKDIEKGRDVAVEREEEEMGNEGRDQDQGHNAHRWPDPEEWGGTDRPRRFSHVVLLPLKAVCRRRFHDGSGFAPGKPCYSIRIARTHEWTEYLLRLKTGF